MTCQRWSFTLRRCGHWQKYHGVHLLKVDWASVGVAVESLRKGCQSPFANTGDLHFDRTVVENSALCTYLSRGESSQVGNSCSVTSSIHLRHCGDSVGAFAVSPHDA